MAASVSQERISAVESDGGVFAPVFIVGCPRSGTTLLAAMIDRHSRFAVPPETHFFDITYESSRWSRGHARLLRALADNHRVADGGVVEEKLCQRFETGPATHARLLRSLLEEFAARKGKSRVAEKTPEHLPFVDLILQWYPQAKVVCIVRDGRDVALSLRRAPWTHDSLRRHAFQWRRAARQAVAFSKTYPASFHCLRFEDLVLDPVPALSAVMEFVGCSFEPDQLNPDKATGVAPAWEKAWKQNAGDSPDASKAHCWRSGGLDKREIWLMNSMMEEQLRQFDYPEAGLAGCPAGLRSWNAACNLALRAVGHPLLKPLRAAVRRCAAARSRAANARRVDGPRSC